MRLPVPLLLLVCALLAVVPAAADAATTSEGDLGRPAQAQDRRAPDDPRQGLPAPARTATRCVFKATGARAVFVKAEPATSDAASSSRSRRSSRRSSR